VNLFESPGFLLNKLAHAMAIELERQLKVYDVTTAQWAILAVLWQQEGISQVELQELMGVEAAAITGVLQRMMRLDLVQRRVDPIDKRIQRVFLTERGRALEQVLIPLAEEVNTHALSGFSIDEQAFFVRLLQRALHNVDHR
jgi:DNA-binding MarR family transcriptional regulator